MNKRCFFNVSTQSCLINLKKNTKDNARHNCLVALVMIAIEFTYVVDCDNSNIFSVMYHVWDLLYLQMSMNATKTQTHAKNMSCALTRWVRSTAYARKDTGSQVEHVKVRNKWDSCESDKRYFRISVIFWSVK